MAPVTICPEPGTWRAWLDGEAAIVGPDEHLAVCAACAAEVARLRADANATAAALALLDLPAQLADRALRVPDRADELVAAGGRRLRYRWLGAAAAVALAVTLVATPAGRGYAEAFLSAFRSEQVSLVRVGPGEGEAAVEVMRELGDVDGTTTGPAPREVASIAEAQATAGFAVAALNADSLPAGVGRKPQIHVQQGHDLGFVFDAERTSAYLLRNGSSLRVPDGYDGARLNLHVPTSVVLQYPGREQLDGVYVGTASSVSADVTGGISLQTLREFLLAVPGLPRGLARQLAAIDDWQATLPIPVPVDLVRAQQTRIAGVDALLVSQPGLGAGFVWQQGDRIVAVAGPYDTTVMRRLAEGIARR